jgi:hypothetical protein
MRFFFWRVYIIMTIWHATNTKFNAGSINVISHAFGQNLFSLDCTRMHEFENFARFLHETLT